VYHKEFAVLGKYPKPPQESKKKKKGKCEAKIEVTEVQGWWLSR